MKKCFTIKNIFDTTYSFIIFFIFISLFIVLILHNNEYLSGIKSGLYFCSNILIPSLFPFIFLSSFIVKSGLSKAMGKIFSPIMKCFFYLPGYTAPSIITGLLGGYPIGAKGVKSLLSEKMINKEQANRIMCFNVCAGPSFIIGIVGEILLKNKNVGVIIFFSNIVFSLIIGMVLGIKSKFFKNEFYETKSIIKNNSYDLKSAVCKSCSETINSSLNMSAFVILFYCFISVVNSLGVEKIIYSFYPNPISKLILPIIFEVNSSCNFIALYLNSPAIMSLAIGWGGLCVHMQIMSIFNKNDEIDFLKFLFFRIIQAIGSSIIVHFATKNLTFDVFNSDNKIKFEEIHIFNSSIYSFFFIFLLCIYLIDKFYKITNKDKLQPDEF